MFVDSNQLICLCDTLVLNKGVFVVDDDTRKNYNSTLVHDGSS